MRAEPIDKLRVRRDWECRLTPDRALQSIEEAEVFLRDRGMLTRTSDSSLPSLFQACHEQPYLAGGRGFASWPATKWPWAAELAERPGVHALKIHRGKTLLLTEETAALADPICRAELARAEASDTGQSRLLAHLAQAGPSLADDVQTELGLKAAELRALRTALERSGALVSRSVILPAAGGGHLHASELARWDQLFPADRAGNTASAHEARPAVLPNHLADLLAAGVAAAVLAPERELVRWFSWQRLFSVDLVDLLVQDGRITRPAPGWVAVPP